MNKDSTLLGNSGAYTSPGTPDYGDNQGKGFQKGWCSERVPLPSNISKERRASVNALMPFNNGRTLPSKWDDAERWITSPVSGSGVCKSLAPPSQRRAKSKSGPLGPAPGDTCFSSFSPGFPLIEGGSTDDIFAGSPFTTGVLVPSGYSFGGIDAHCVPAQTEYRGAHSELFIESSYPDSQDEKIDGNNVSCVVLRRDMATQMSPESSPKGRVLLSTSPPPVEPNSHYSARVEVRDVQVDKRITMTKQPKRHKKRREKNESTEIKDLALTWNPSEGASELSKIQKEEARITAWENLQNAKAEAAIQKLEMKLEKKRSESMDKIMNKLRIAQMKAQEMRKRMSANEGPRTSLKGMGLEPVGENPTHSSRKSIQIRDALLDGFLLGHGIGGGVLAGIGGGVLAGIGDGVLTDSGDGVFIDSGRGDLDRQRRR
ncbi:hypothetical protein L1987_24528 [Smallanthus sonchifolius]|uniref:Uncharacterized protein n=1 Tax=Smallanthus sonchifolius TaxID=185202 RepID=A0ACB9IKN1_9ASTR|nr:hypothetical protein L1987_24528 [Smallanthus sonchifolius]